jgi:hypothetical protein
MPFVKPLPENSDSGFLAAAYVVDLIAVDDKERVRRMRAEYHSHVAKYTADLLDRLHSGVRLTRYLEPERYSWYKGEDTFRQDMLDAINRPELFWADADFFEYVSLKYKCTLFMVQDRAFSAVRTSAPFTSAGFIYLTREFSYSPIAFGDEEDPVYNAKIYSKMTNKQKAHVAYCLFKRFGQLPFKVDVPSQPASPESELSSESTLLPFNEGKRPSLPPVPKLTLEDLKARIAKVAVVKPRQTGSETSTSTSDLASVPIKTEASTQPDPTPLKTEASTQPEPKPLRTSSYSQSETAPLLVSSATQSEPSPQKNEVYTQTEAVGDSARSSVKSEPSSGQTSPTASTDYSDFYTASEIADFKRPLTVEEIGDIATSCDKLVTARDYERLEALLHITRDFLLLMEMNNVRIN